MVGILLDTKYASSLWCKSIYQSLTERLRQSRVSYCRILEECPAELETVFVIASGKAWTVNAIKQLNCGGIHPILLCNQLENLPGCIYSCVCSDINTSMKNLLDTLKVKGKSRVALYGINASSMGDMSRVESLLNWKEPCFKTMQVFYNNGSLENCFSSFCPHMGEFDAAICANGFAAVSLVRNLKRTDPARLKELYIVSCAANKLSDQYRENIVSLNMNFEQHGRAAFYLYRALAKHPYLSEMTVKVVWSMEEQQPAPERTPLQLELEESDDAFYSDTELAEMLIVDKLLTLSDEVEKNLVGGLVKGCSYEELADRCFLTVGGIKYRIKKLVEKIGAADKNQIIELVKKYIEE